MVSFYAGLRPLIFTLPPETAHKAAIGLLRTGMRLASCRRPPLSLQVRTLGLTFKSPLGMAAGFDKNAEAINGILRQGFAFTEAGTVTPWPQPGNTAPRLYRLVEDEAIINRLGFNNKGLDYFTRQFARRNPELGVAGANIGKNRYTRDAIKDYIIAMRAVYKLADYITVNISSPNTQGLRELQKYEELTALLTALMEERKKLADQHERQIPLLLKIAPDLQSEQAEQIAQAVRQHGVDGLVISNTTTSRPAGLKSSHTAHEGGLSGAPLFNRSTDLLRRMYKLTEGQIPLIGVGGVRCADSAYAKIKAGATLVQLYSALIYQGFGLIQSIQDGLIEHIERDGYATIADAVGRDVH